jgi:hypothetical protein
MLSPDQLRALDHDQRAELLRRLVELQAPSSRPTPAQRRFRTTVRTLVTVGAVLLVPWTIYLAATLPRRSVTEHWRGAWVGFDILLIVALATTAWLGWQRRQLVAIGLVASSVLLACDAWFDVTLTRGPDRTVSLLTALLVELPVAVLFARAALNVFRFNADLVWSITGRTGERPPLHRLPLLGRLAQPDVET